MAGWSIAPMPRAATARAGKCPSRSVRWPCANEGGAVLSLRSGFHFFDFKTRRSHPHQRNPSRRIARRGSMTARSIAKAASLLARWTTMRRDPVGKLFRLDPDLSVHTLDTGIVCSNGPCWSPDGKTFYFADHYARAIWAYDYDTVTGRSARAGRSRHSTRSAASRTAPRSMRKAMSGASPSMPGAWSASIPMASLTGSSACRCSRRRA